MFMGLMRVSLDPKPIGAFIEYTLKPLIDYSRELIDVLDRHEIKLGNTLQYAFRLYIVDIITRSLVTLISVAMICYTVWNCLHTRV